MLSRSTLELLDAIDRMGSFSKAANLLNKVPSTISHAVKQLEAGLGVELFDRTDVKLSLTAAGEYLVQEARVLLKHMDDVETNVVRVANGWQPKLAIAIDAILPQVSVQNLIKEFCVEFTDVELIVRNEVYNGVWDALVMGRADIAIGATSAIPVDGQFDYKEMGEIDWVFVVGAKHDLTFPGSDLSDANLVKYSAISLEDTSINIPQRTTWVLPKQRKLVVASWEQALGAAKSGAGIGYVPKHIAQPYIADGSLTQIILPHPKAPSACCLAWNTANQSPALTWVLTFLGDMELLNDQWIDVSS